MRDGRAARCATTARVSPPEDLPRVFDRFYRSPAARGRPGSGLGLAIVRQIAETHGGAVHAANDPGGGARLTLELPPLPMSDAELRAAERACCPGCRRRSGSSSAPLRRFSGCGRFDVACRRERSQIARRHHRSAIDPQRSRPCPAVHRSSRSPSCCCRRGAACSWPPAAAPRRPRHPLPAAGTAGRSEVRRLRQVPARTRRQAEAASAPGGGTASRAAPVKGGRRPANDGSGAEGLQARYRPEPQKLNLSPQQKVEHEEAVRSSPSACANTASKSHASSSEGRVSIRIHAQARAPAPRTPKAPPSRKRRAPASGCCRSKGPQRRSSGRSEAARAERPQTPAGGWQPPKAPAVATGGLSAVGAVAGRRRLRWLAAGTLAVAVAAVLAVVLLRLRLGRRVTAPGNRRARRRDDRDASPGARCLKARPSTARSATARRSNSTTGSAGPSPGCRPSAR